MNSSNGRLLSAASSGAGVDIIAYNPGVRHIYLPGADSATMAIVAISDTGAATVLRTVETATGAHCVTANDRDDIFICDPRHGQLLLFKDETQPGTAPTKVRE